MEILKWLQKFIKWIKKTSPSILPKATVFTIYRLTTYTGSRASVGLPRYSLNPHYNRWVSYSSFSPCSTMLYIPQSIVHCPKPLIPYPAPTHPIYCPISQQPSLLLQWGNGRRREQQPQGEGRGKQKPCLSIPGLEHLPIPASLNYVEGREIRFNVDRGRWPCETFPVTPSTCSSSGKIWGWGKTGKRGNQNPPASFFFHFLGKSQLHLLTSTDTFCKPLS